MGRRVEVEADEILRRRSGVESHEALADVAGPAVGLHLREPDEQVSVRVVRPVVEHHHQGAEHVERRGEGRARERRDMVTLSESRSSL